MKKMLVLLAMVAGLTFGCATAAEHKCYYGPKPEESLTVDIGGSIILKYEIDFWEKWAKKNPADTFLHKERFLKTFETRLVYLGLTGDYMRFGYREYIDDTPKPALSEELAIPKTESTFTLKGITLTVLSILPEGRITCKVAPVERCNYDPRATWILDLKRERDRL